MMMICFFLSSSSRFFLYFNASTPTEMAGPHQKIRRLRTPCGPACNLAFDAAPNPVYSFCNLF
jgi:hypothetical protein